jgi:hypothetical protein
MHDLILVPRSYAHIAPSEDISEVFRRRNGRHLASLITHTSESEGGRRNTQRCNYTQGITLPPTLANGERPVSSDQLHPRGSSSSNVSRRAPCRLQAYPPQSSRAGPAAKTASRASGIPARPHPPSQSITLECFAPAGRTVVQDGERLNGALWVGFRGGGRTLRGSCGT